MRSIRDVIFVILITALALAACNSAETEPENNPPAEEVAAAEISPTEAPTIVVPTATPVQTEPAAAAPEPTPTLTPPASTPTPAPSPTPVVYVVEEYDTLLGIAIDFDTTTEAIAAANGINENDFLFVGQELIIPSGEQIAAGSVVVAGTSAPTEAVDAQSSQESVVLVTATAVPETVSQVNASAESGAAQPVAQIAAAEPVPELELNRAPNINPLTGLPVDDPATLQRRPLLVRIGNDVGARASQAGLNSADVVYEEIAEWWLTRFTAIFLSETPTTVAPIRSARLINVQLVPQYQGALAHSGGSDPVRWEISQAPIVNLDEFYNPLPYYYRPNEGWQTRLAIDTQAARNYMAAQGTEKAVALNGFLFSDTIDSGQPVENIFIPYPRATTFTQWRYIPSSGKYIRFANDAPLSDANGLGQVSASNVIVYFAEHQETDIVEDSNGATSIRILVNGKGPAWFFRDGKLNKGFWQTDGARTPYFGFEDGSPYPLKPGNTWIEVVPTYFTIGLDDPSQANARP